MAENLLEPTWTALDSHEIRLVIDAHFPGPGQYDGLRENPNIICVPLAGVECRLKLVFGDKDDKKRIVSIEPGLAFDRAQWKTIRSEIEALGSGPVKVGREFSFSGKRVLGSWRGARSGVQILPPTPDVPRATEEMADHPFVLEFPVMVHECLAVTEYRRRKLHRGLTGLLNVLLTARATVPASWGKSWGIVQSDDGQGLVTRWVNLQFYAELGDRIIDSPSSLSGDKLQELAASEYYQWTGHDGTGLRVPVDLDKSICVYQRLSREDRERFDRAAFWVTMASRQWPISASLSFTALVSAVESLTGRGEQHRGPCSKCGETTVHEVPGATQRFRDFFEKYAPQVDLQSILSKQYGLRSDILHGSALMQMDEGTAFGWDPPSMKERDLHFPLATAAPEALRRWLTERT
jgi:hypothetical protein